MVNQSQQFPAQGLNMSQNVSDRPSLSSSQKLQMQAEPIFMQKNEMLHIKELPSKTMQTVMKQYIQDMRYLFKWDQDEKDKAQRDARMGKKPGATNDEFVGIIGYQ